MQSGLHERMQVRRYSADGELDTGFGVDGTTELGGFGNYSPYAARLQSDGKLLIAGRGFSRATGADFVIARLAP